MTDPFEILYQALCSYEVLSPKTWSDFKQICDVKELSKDDLFIRPNEIPSVFGFVLSGLLRAYVTDEKGDDYNKVFFPENTFPGSMVALLTNTESSLAIEALEPSLIIQIDFNGFRALLDQYEDLKRYQINYLEKNWVIAKESREIALVQEDATARYLHFRNEHPNLEQRIPLYHIASHIGVTPTQLSRIRKKLS